MALTNGQRVEVTAGSGLLVGQFAHALDPKKRLTVPAGWRNLMGDPAYVYVFIDPTEKCLNLLPPAEMEVRLAKFRQRALFDKDSSRALRAIGQNSEQDLVDVQGRIRISDRFLEFAQLSDTVVMIGAVNRIQLWSPALQPAVEKVDQAELAAAFGALDF